MIADTITSFSCKRGLPEDAVGGVRAAKAAGMRVAESRRRYRERFWQRNTPISFSIRSPV